MIALLIVGHVAAASILLSISFQVQINILFYYYMNYLFSKQGIHEFPIVFTYLYPVTLAWFSIQILVNSKIFKLSLNLSLTHLRAQIACYELKGDLSPVMLKEIFHDSFENFEITRICMENHASVTGWQKLFFSYKCFQLSAAVAIATFEIYG